MSFKKKKKKKKVFLYSKNPSSGQFLMYTLSPFSNSPGNNVFHRTQNFFLDSSFFFPNFKHKACSMKKTS